VRHIVKGRPPVTVTETLAAPTTDLSTTARARAAFDQIDKARVRVDLADEQRWLCAFCMLRVDPEAVAAPSDGARPEATMKIAHRTPIDVDSQQALSWKNLLGSCDGGQRSGGRRKSCDFEQGPKALTVDPTETASCARLRYERRDRLQGLFITSDDAALKTDVEQTLALNSGDLPELREQKWKAFQCLQHKNAPRQYGKPAWAAYYDTWIRQYGDRLPEMVGVIEAKVR
jgi:uncharacterized protein (TIGR02646 family)